MTPFVYDGRALSSDGVALADIAARIGTPCYVYSARSILNNFTAYDQAFGEVPHTICYAVKANSNLAILRLLAEAGAGFDIVSGGELYRVLRAGGDPKKVVFSGVGKTADEIDQALEAGILSFNTESEPEIALIDSLAHRRGIKARIAVRVNPDIAAGSHEYISTGTKANKFGIDIDQAEGVYERAAKMENLIVDGVSCHVGSQMFDPKPMGRAVERVLELVERLRAKGFDIQHADLGGGLGVAYKPDDPVPAIGEFISGLVKQVDGRGLHVMVEPGRSMVGGAGVLLTRVLYRKRTGEKEFVVVDAAMNDLLRPALYQAHHQIVPVREVSGPLLTADVVGPICESGDFLAKGAQLQEVFPGDLLSVSTAGAYGFVMASTYNSRPRAAEVLIEGDGEWRVIRQRETYEDLVRGED